LAPEVVNRTHLNNEKSDVYSLGLILVECWKMIEVRIFSKFRRLEDEELKVHYQHCMMKVTSYFLEWTLTVLSQ